MKIFAIIFFSFGILLILFGISIFTPFLSWIGKRFNSSKSTSVNYRQPSSIRVTNMFMGICFFAFGLFITIASAGLLNVWNTPSSNSLLTKTVPQSVSVKTETFSNPTIPGKNPPPSIKSENKLLEFQYRLDCPDDAAGLNMRKQAGLNTEIITLIPCNAKLVKDRRQRYYQDGVEWDLVEYQGNTGWVAGKYLKKLANKPKQNQIFSQLVAKKRP